jgi:lipopolysaccharide/colanic/teichoic acid biosynthesis glycosyltransferase
MDRDYARNWSLLRDLRVLLHTPSAVLRRSGAY